MPAAPGKRNAEAFLERPPKGFEKSNLQTIKLFLCAKLNSLLPTREQEAHAAEEMVGASCLRNFPPRNALLNEPTFQEIPMQDTSQIKEQMDVISSDRKTVGKVDHLEGSDKIKLTRQSSPDGQHHHFIPLSWIDHVDQHVHLNKSGADVTAHWQHERT
jgi:hypothetical protein